MNTSRILYRSRQFWQAISSTRSSEQDLEQVHSILTDPEAELFLRMQASEQTHSLRLLNQLTDQGEENLDLHKAALLHDVGKIRAPLRTWERVMIVVVQGICKDCVSRWGSSEIYSLEKSPGWRRAFIVAEQHPAWGADLAAKCGAAPLTVSLIARHQEQLPQGANSMEEILLRKLQAVDDNN
jgi:hypothetical protein